MRAAVAVSAGGVVARQADHAYEIVLVGRSTQSTWGLPKGTPDDGESREATALREVAEETGIEPRIVAPLGSIEYSFVARNTRFRKTVHFFLMEAVGGDLGLHDHEYDLVEWVPIDDAIVRLSYENEAAVVRAARNALHSRHGQTGDVSKRTTTT